MPTDVRSGLLHRRDAAETEAPPLDRTFRRFFMDQYLVSGPIMQSSWCLRGLVTRYLPLRPNRYPQSYGLAFLVPGMWIAHNHESRPQLKHAIGERILFVTARVDSFQGERH